MFISIKVAMFNFTNSDHVLQDFLVLEEHFIKTVASVAGQTFVFHNDFS